MYSSSNKCKATNQLRGDLYLDNVESRLGLGMDINFYNEQIVIFQVSFSLWNLDIFSERYSGLGIVQDELVFRLIPVGLVLRTELI